MPRKAKSKAEAVDYGNRTDLPQGIKPQAPAAAPDQAYGEAGAQLTAQQNMPLPDLQAGQQDPYQAALAAAQEHDFQPVGLGDPSSRPMEPVTAGLPSGAGPGPEVIAQPERKASDVLSAMAAASNDPTLSIIAENARRKGH